MIQKVKAATGDNIHIALDTILEEETQFIAIKTLAEGELGKLLVILLPVEGISDVREDVEVTCPSHISHYLISGHPQLMNDTLIFAVTIIFSAYGIDFRGFCLDDDDRRELSVFLRKVPGLVKDGKLKPIPVKKFGGGLGKVYMTGVSIWQKGGGIEPCL